MNPKLKILLGVVVVLAVVGGFYKVALAPKYARAASLQAEIDTSRGLVDTARAKAQGLENAKAGYSADYATLASLGKAVPADDDMRSLLIQLDTAARRSGIDFNKLSVQASSAAETTAPSGSAAATQAAAAALPPGAAVGPAGLPTMPFSFEFEGSYVDFSSFLARVQRFVTARGDGIDVKGRLLTVDGFSLKPASGNPREILASIGATAYLVNPAEGVDAGGTAAGPAGVAAPAEKPEAAPPLAIAPAAGVR